MFRWLVDNLSTLALAFILALFVWFLVIRETNPIVEEPYLGSVSIVLLNQPAGSQVVNNPEDTVKVVVRGPRQEIEALQADDFSAVIDLSTISFGGVEVPVVVSIDNHPLISVIEQDVERIFIRLEEFRHYTLPITPTLVG